MNFEIRISKTNESREIPTDAASIGFGKVFSDHMFVADYDGSQWTDFRIEPYGNFYLSPATSALHYGQSIFEGMKAFKIQGEVFVFRPLENAKRLNISAERMMMPQLPEEIFLKGVEMLVDVDRKWVPEIPGCSLYLRPFMFATDDFVGVRPSEKYRFVIFSCPVGPYYAKPLKVKVEENYSRAASGGTGYTKCAGNYGGAMYPTKMAQNEGFDQVIWTDPESHSFVEETGTTNVFAVIGDTVITPALKDSMLSGITRKSAVEILKNHHYKVEERPLAVKELIEGAENGSLKEIFITGTAATLILIEGFKASDKYFTLPASGADSVTTFLSTYFNDLRTGVIEDAGHWMHKVERVNLAQ